MLGIILGILVLIVLIVVITNIKIVPQASVYVVERLGAYYATWETGLHFKMPFFDRIAKRVSLKEQVADFADRHGRLLPGDRRQALHLRRRAPALRHREPDRYHPA